MRCFEAHIPLNADTILLNSFIKIKSEIHIKPDKDENMFTWKVKNQKFGKQYIYLDYEKEFIRIKFGLNTYIADFIDEQIKNNEVGYIWIWPEENEKS